MPNPRLRNVSLALATAVATVLMADAAAEPLIISIDGDVARGELLSTDTPGGPTIVTSSDHGTSIIRGTGRAPALSIDGTIETYGTYGPAPVAIAPTLYRPRVVRPRVVGAYGDRGVHPRALPGIGGAVVVDNRGGSIGRLNSSIDTLVDVDRF